MKHLLTGLISLIVIGTTLGQTTTPTTTTMSATTTTTLPPEPPTGTWYVKGDVVCIIAQLGARFSFNYTGKDGQPHTSEQDLPMQNQTHSSGNCGKSMQPITISWGASTGVNCSADMTLRFYNHSGKFLVNDIDVSFSSGCFHDAPKEDPVTGKVNKTLFQATIGQSYMCNSEQDLNMTTNIHSLKVTMSDVQLQAFGKTNSTQFETAQECPQDAETSNIVPIAVGAALAALVLIVLIAYLISRNRSQRGYESV